MTKIAVAGLAAVLTLAAAAAGRSQEAPAASGQSAPPPPASASAPSAPDQTAPIPEAPPEEGDKPPPVAAPAAPSRPAPPEPPPKPPEPLKRTRENAAILQATDKITAETLRFEARAGAPVRYKDLIITVRACETSAPDEAVKDSIAHLEVLSQPASAQGRPVAARPVYRGWMFANSPGLHPFEHPVYDLWLIACRTVAPSAPAARR